MWIEHSNEQKGVAPGTFSVMRKFDEELVGPARVLNDMHYDMRQDMRLSRHRTFAWRFRQRWQLCLQALKDRGVVPIQQRQSKVIFFFREKVVFWLRFSTLIFGASSDTKIGPLQRNSLRFVDSAAGLVFVPKKLPKNVRPTRLFFSEKVVQEMLSGMALKSRGDCCFFCFASAPLLTGVVHVEMESVPACNVERRVNEVRKDLTTD